jgi:predicted nucleic acid-binding protein
VDKEIIVDTSALIAFFVKSETHHESAQKYYLENPHNNWIILESVFDETVTWIRSKIIVISMCQIAMIWQYGKLSVSTMIKNGVTQIVLF